LLEHWLLAHHFFCQEELEISGVGLLENNEFIRGWIALREKSRKQAEDTKYFRDKQEKELDETEDLSWISKFDFKEATAVYVNLVPRKVARPDIEADDYDKILEIAKKHDVREMDLDIFDSTSFHLTNHYNARFLKEIDEELGIQSFIIELSFESARFKKSKILNTQQP
jgi:hypothetical protein